MKLQYTYLMNESFFKNINRLVVIPTIAVVASALFWVIDASVDHFVFGEFNSLLESIFVPESHELYMRLTVVLLFAVFAYIAQLLVNEQQKLLVELARQNDQLEDTVSLRTEELEKLATTDSLTNTYNRRKFNQQLNHEMERSRRHHHPLSLVIIDIDFFKSVNDQYGHAAGDDVLISMSKVMKTLMRKTDFICRIGGEEFGIILCDTDEGNAYDVAEKVRICIENTEFSISSQVTISAGIAEYNSDEVMNEFFKRADSALYEAKNTGRNRVFASSSLDYLS